MCNDFKKWYKEAKKDYIDFCEEDPSEIIPYRDFVEKAWEAGQKNKCIICKLIDKIFKNFT